MSGVNKVILIGNLGRDPEVRRTQDGKPVVNLSLATSQVWRDKITGEKREKAEWHRVVIFNEGLAKVAEQYLRKGSKVYVEGRLQTRKWQDQSGQDRYSTEVVLQGYSSTLTMLDGPSSERKSTVEKPKYNAYAAAKDDGETRIPLEKQPETFDDEIPF